MELVVDPVTHISWSVGPIEERSFALESIILEVSFIVDSVRVNESSISIFHAILNHPFKMGFVLVCLHYEHAFIFVFCCQLILAERVFGRVWKGLSINGNVRFPRSEGEIGGLLG